VSDSEETPVVETPSISGPGAMLRAAREARRMTVAEAAAALKMRPWQIEAMENEDFSRLSGGTVVRGFVRNYARLLKIDPAPVLDVLAERPELSQTELNAPVNEGVKMPIPGIRHSRSLTVGTALALLALIVALALYFDLFGLHQILKHYESAASAPLSPPALPSPPTPAAPAETETQIMPPQPEPVTESEPVAAPAPVAEAQPVAAAAPLTETKPVVIPAPVTETKPVAIPAPLTVTKPVAVPTPVTVTEPLAPPAPAAGAEPDAAPRENPSATPAHPPAPSVPAAGMKRLTFNFDDNSWVEVKDGAGNIIFSQVGAKGTTHVVDGRPPFQLIVGNAAQVRLQYKDQPVDLRPHTRVAVARLVLN